MASHRAAARLHGILIQSQIVEITARTSARRSGVTIHRHQLPPAHVTDIDGLPVTTFIRTLIDLADVLSIEQSINVINEAEVLRLDFTGLHELMAASNGRHGLTKLRTALARFHEGMTLSELEVAFADLLLYLTLRFMDTDIAQRPREVLEDLVRARERASRAGPPAPPAAASSASRRSARAAGRGRSG